MISMTISMTISMNISMEGQWKRTCFGKHTRDVDDDIDENDDEIDDIVSLWLR